jgi:hypothetical protein
MDWKPIIRSAVVLLCVLCSELAVFGVAKPSFEAIEAGFRQPPQRAGVRSYWWWLNGNVTKEAITRDLEQMKAKGFSGALLFDAGGAEQRGNRQVPAGPTFGSEAWLELFAHTVTEAQRLGLELSVSIQSGWNVGGPMITEEMAAKTLTWSEVRIEGPRPIKQTLPVPKHKGDYYRDIAVLALPVKPMPNVGATNAPAAGRRPIRDLDKKAVFDEIGWAAPDCRFLLEDVEAVEGEEDARLSEIMNLSGTMDSDGILTWDVPEGVWTVLRFGYTLNGAHVSTSSAGWEGRVIDYMDPEALNTYWKAVIEPMLVKAGPAAGKTLKYLQSDSWECGGANWTKAFAQEFEKRRGYNPIAYLPVIAGKIIESRDVSNGFLADFRKTVGDCVAENHYGVLAELAAAHGMGIHPESGGPHAGPFDAIKCLGQGAFAMGEFWVPSPHRSKLVERFYVKQTSSTAHIYGQPYAAAEAFTSIGPHWEDVLWSSHKPTFDHEFCAGLTLCFMHTFTCSPESMGVPGQEYFAGTHFNPQVTWWEYADGFLDYLHRCQFVAQQGRFVADVLYYQGDHVPNLVQLKEADPAGAMPGYDYDVTDEEILLNAAGVQDGRIVLKSGQTYRLLVLPSHKVLSLAAMEKIKTLVEEGATVLGPRPVKTVSLAGYPEGRGRFEQLRDQVWGEVDSPAGQHTLGKGKVIWGKTARQTLSDEGVSTDFEMAQGNWQKSMDYVHYSFADAEVYYVCNQTDKELSGVGLFRVSGRRPQLWNPLNGDIRDAKAFTQGKGQTEVPLEFGPYGSWFVVFREPISVEAKGSGTRNTPEVLPLMTIEGAWQVCFDPKWGGPEKVQFDKLISWTDHTDPGIRFYSGKAIYQKSFDLNGPVESGGRCWLDLGMVKDTGIASVRLNGRELGVLWTKPFRVEVTGLLKPEGNRLEVSVVNSWRNRLVCDRDLPEMQRLTRTNITIRPEWKILESGLLGPVSILVEK